MTAPRFLSTAAFTRRHRLRGPQVDRATFVIFSLHGQRFASPVESVERVLRNASSGSAPSNGAAVTSVGHGGRRVPLIDLRAALGLARAGSVDQSVERTLVFTVHGAWVAATVDAVYEVATIDASLVQPLAPPSADTPAARPDAARGRFVRHDQEVLVLDMVRVVRAVYEAAQRVARDDRAGATAPHP